MNKIALAFLALGALLGKAGDGQAGSILAPPGPHGTVEGIDVSQLDGSIDWSAVAASGKLFAIARVSDGLGHLDSAFMTNWQGIENAGLVRGAYQFFEPAQDPVAQANLLISQIGPIGTGELPPVLDIEVTGGVPLPQLNVNIDSWITTVRAATGLNPIIYTADSFWQSIGAPSNDGADLWIAAWGVFEPRIPSPPWKNWVIWQYSNSGFVPGVPEVVDLDRFNGSLADLQAFAQSSTVPEPSPLVVSSILFGMFGVAWSYRRLKKTTATI